MTKKSSLPGFLKPFLRTLRYAYGKLTHRPRSREELQSYWSRPPDKGNFPEDYLQGAARSEWLAGIVKRHLKEQGSILEIGCNVGRNLAHLYRAGFRRLAAIEINEDALRLLRQTFPEVAAVARFERGAVEEKIKVFPDNEFDLVFTMAVLEHIHKDSEWIFGEMVRVTKDLLITVEDEREVSERHFPRRYDRIFKELGMTQVETHDCSAIEGLGAGFTARVFSKTGPRRH